jgi:hypothetical protein
MLNNNVAYIIATHNTITGKAAETADWRLSCPITLICIRKCEDPGRCLDYSVEKFDKKSSEEKKKTMGAELVGEVPKKFGTPM